MANRDDLPKSQLARRFRKNSGIGRPRWRPSGAAKHAQINEFAPALRNRNWERPDGTFRARLWHTADENRLNEAVPWIQH